LTGSPALIAAGVAAAALIAGIVVYILRRPSPAERERRRRFMVHREGRITDGTVFDVAEAGQGNGAAPENLIYYTYSIGGVDYSACQDVSTLAERVGGDTTSLIGAVYVKYQSKNPHNSIIVCEDWSGLRPRRRTDPEAIEPKSEPHA
jgi:hypothetical protein